MQAKTFEALKMRLLYELTPMGAKTRMGRTCVPRRGERGGPAILKPPALPFARPDEAGDWAGFLVSRSTTDETGAYRPDHSRNGTCEKVLGRMYPTAQNSSGIPHYLLSGNGERASSVGRSYG